MTRHAWLILVFSWLLSPAWGQPEVAPLPCGAFEIALGAGEGARLEVRERSSGKTVWSAPADSPLLAVGRGKERVEQVRHSYRISDRSLWRTRGQRLDPLRRDGNGVLLRGALLGGPAGEIAFCLRFVPIDEQTLGFRVTLGGASVEPGDLRGATGALAGDEVGSEQQDADGAVATVPNRITLRWGSDPSERIYGMGAQFTHLDLKGHRVPVWCQEQGQGRGKQPVTWVFNRLSGGLGGDAYTTYTSVPLALSSRGTGILLENSEYLTFDFQAGDSSEVEVFSDRLEGRLFVGDDLLGLLEVVTRTTGRMAPLPDWMHEGAVVGTVGGTEWVEELEEKLAKLGTPVSAWFLQDWVGERGTAFGKRLIWNWVANPSVYGDLSAFVARRRERGARVLGYLNPFLSKAPQARRNLYQEAADQGFLVKNQSGEPYEIGAGGFSSGLLDVTHPGAREWFKAVVRDELLAQGLSGWMSDFCEQLPYDAVLHSGSAPELHNRYPELFQALQREALQEAGASDVVFFARSGTYRSPGIAPLFWLGDQLTTWDRQDGMHSMLIGMLSSGLSGFTLNHGDAGGYLSLTLLNLPIAFRRSEELLTRWLELCAFTPVFRTHDANSRGKQFHSNDRALRSFARNAKLFAALFPYRRELMARAASHGTPLVRPLFLHYPNDRRAQKVEDAFLLGPDLLVAPVLTPGARARDVYLPAGRWVSIWSGQAHEGGRVVRCPAPLGQPPAFVKAGSSLAGSLPQRLVDQGLRLDR